MCGIAGLAGDFVPGLVERMNAAQAHRGPDGSGIFERPELQIALGHVRLAILDLSDFAAQPMLSPDGRYVLAYNGEIYNFAELQRDLAGRSPKSSSSGDTEVLLHGLMRWGSRFVERLNGMFAFALWDNYERELLLARDPLGIKPLYYAQPKPGSLIFASELKAILRPSGNRARARFSDNPAAFGILPFLFRPHCHSRNQAVGPGHDLAVESGDETNSVHPLLGAAVRRVQCHVSAGKW